MPKIFINEIDKTKAGIGAYTNFSVVVPGFLGSKGEEVLKANDSKYISVFDEYGVYECNSQADFKKYIGAVSPDQNILISAKAPIVVKLDDTYTEKVGEGTEAKDVTYNISLGGAT
jgi:hypothetical protein